MAIYLWAIARDNHGVIEYYADEFPGTDIVRWVIEADDAAVFEIRGWAEAVKDELMRQGFTQVFVTVVRV